MKKFFLLMVAAIAAMQLSAAPVDMTTALNKAQSFVSKNSSAQKLMNSTSNEKFVLHRAVMGDAKLAEPVFYVFNSSNSFIIVSGEDRSEEILAYGEGNIDLDNIPDNMKAWLNRYKEQIEYLQAHPGLQVELPSKLMAPSMRISSVSQLLSARWDQTAPFWNQCVFNNTQCLTGCPATSLAQVFYYWKFPTAATPAISGYSSSGYTIPALSSTTFDWANMRDYYGWNGGTGTAAQKAAVATLMRYVGQAEKMDYGPNGSGIPSSQTSLISNACKTFGYDNNVRAIYKTTAWGQTQYTDTQWANLIQNELAAGHPIVYCALSTQSGHAFNVDGYDASANTYHINWGWSGVGNAYYALNAFTYDGETFNDYQSMVIGIQPPGGQVTFPSITADVESLDFGSTNTGTTVTRTFHVTGVNLLGDISFTRSGNASYSVTPETLTAAQVMAGADITVTYAPTTSGNHTANIVISGGAAESLSISCTGTAQAVPLITTDQSEMSFSTTVGEPVTSTFNVQGYNLTGSVYLSLQNTRVGFSIDKANITKAAATNGAVVTVTYNPTTAGNHSTRIMLRSAGADTIYINLNGTASIVKYAPVMLPADEAYISPTSFRADWTDETAASGVQSYTLQYTTNGQNNTVPNITNKNYTLTNLIAGATYSYKVKAFYTDGTESAWSNTQQVTLPQGHAYDPGDVNHDSHVNISDVTALIDYLLDNTKPICLICADVNGDTIVSITDVTALIDILLN